MRILNTFSKISLLKKLLAITLLVIYLFNLAGYPLLFGYLSRQSSTTLTRKIERHIYAEKDLVEIKVHLNLPYYNVEDVYEPVEGEITINDNHYNYVKRKVLQDTLFLMCLPNKKKDHLQTAKNDYGKTANDFDGEEKNKNTVKKENSISQYQPCHTDYTLTPPQSGINKQSSFVYFFIPDSFISSLDLPPELNSQHLSTT